MFPLRSFICPVVCLVVLLGSIGCDTKTPSAPSTPPVPGTTTVVGTVLNTQTRQPIAGARITVSTQVAAPSSRSAISLADGSFRVEAVLVGSGSVRVEAEGYFEFSQDLTLVGAEVRTEVALVPTAPPPPPPPPALTSIGGLVTSRQTNQPINGATVTFTLTTGERFVGTTLIDGQFSLQNIPIGAVGDLRIEAQNHRTEESRFTVEPNLFVTVGLSQGS